MLANSATVTSGNMCRYERGREGGRGRGRERGREIGRDRGGGGEREREGGGERRERKWRREGIKREGRRLMYSVTRVDVTYLE